MLTQGIDEFDPMLAMNWTKSDANRAKSRGSFCRLRRSSSRLRRLEVPLQSQAVFFQDVPTQHGDQVCQKEHECDVAQMSRDGVVAAKLIEDASREWQQADQWDQCGFGKHASRSCTSPANAGAMTGTSVQGSCGFLVAVRLRSAGQMSPETRSRQSKNAC